MPHRSSRKKRKHARPAKGRGKLIRQFIRCRKLMRKLERLGRGKGRAREIFE